MPHHSPFEGVEQGMAGMKQEMGHVSDFINKILQNQGGGGGKGGGGGDSGGGMGAMFDPQKCMQAIEEGLKKNIFGA